MPFTRDELEAAPKKRDAVRGQRVGLFRAAPAGKVPVSTNMESRE